MSVRKVKLDSELFRLRRNFDSQFSRPIKKLAGDVIANLPEGQISLEGVILFTSEIVRCVAMQLLFEALEARIEAIDEDEQNFAN